MGIFGFLQKRKQDDDEFDYIASGDFLDDEEDEERECTCSICGRTFVWSEGESLFNELISPDEADFYDISGDELCGYCAADSYEESSEAYIDMAINEWGHDPEMYGR